MVGGRSGQNLRRRLALQGITWILQLVENGLLQSFQLANRRFWMWFEVIIARKCLSIAISRGRIASYLAHDEVGLGLAR